MKTITLTLLSAIMLSAQARGECGFVTSQFEFRDEVARSEIVAVFKWNAEKQDYAVLETLRGSAVKERFPGALSIEKWKSIFSLPYEDGSKVQYVVAVVYDRPGRERHKAEAWFLFSRKEHDPDLDWITVEDAIQFVRKLIGPKCDPETPNP